MDRQSQNRRSEMQDQECKLLLNSTEEKEERSDVLSKFRATESNLNRSKKQKQKNE